MGDYRLFYTIDAGKLLIFFLDIKRRNDAYWRRSWVYALDLRHYQGRLNALPCGLIINYL